HAWTDEPRWKAAWEACADDVWSRWDEAGVWEVKLSGSTMRPLGPAHGFAGNVLALAQGGERLDEIRSRGRATAEREAIREDELATWPPGAGGPLVQRDGPMRVQWCVRAPGLVSSVDALLAVELLIGGAALTW